MLYKRCCCLLTWCVPPLQPASPLWPRFPLRVITPPCSDRPGPRPPDQPPAAGQPRHGPALGHRVQVGGEPGPGGAHGVGADVARLPGHLPHPVHRGVVTSLCLGHKVAVAAPAQGLGQPLAHGLSARAARVVSGAAIRLKHHLRGDNMRQLK